MGSTAAGKDAFPPSDFLLTFVVGCRRRSGSFPRSRSANWEATCVSRLGRFAPRPRRRPGFDRNRRRPRSRRAVRLSPRKRSWRRADQPCPRPQKFFPSISRSMDTSIMASAKSLFSLAFVRRGVLPLEGRRIRLTLKPLQPLQPLGLGLFHAAVFRAPLVKRRIADAGLAAQLGRAQPSLMLFQNPDDLLFAEPTASQVRLLRWRTD